MTKIQLIRQGVSFYCEWGVIGDELALPFGKIRLGPKGSDGGHNGLKNIQETLNTNNYARLRFGISNEFNKGSQVNYVLGKWSDEEKKTFEQYT